MVTPRSWVAVLAAQISTRALRTVGSGGTTLPGRIATLISRALLADVLASTPTVLVAGTNGKTTTVRFIVAALKTRSRAIMTNSSGANLFDGIVAAVAQAQSNGARRGAETAVFEVDELALPRVAREVRPSVLVLTNLYRDQLDRYGEIDRIVATFARAIAELPAEATVVANADDPRLVDLVEASGARAVWFGVEHDRGHRGVFLLDRRLCPRCGALLEHDVRGRFACTGCGFAAPEPVDRAALTATSERGLVAEIDGNRIETSVPGAVNLANLAAAYATARVRGIPTADVVAALQTVAAPYGRHETVSVNGRPTTLVLLKNPVGFNAFIADSVIAPGSTVVIALNDLPADGEDVSWIWDVDFEQLAERGVNVVAAGRRRADVAVRLKYAGVPVVGTIENLDDVVKALAVENAATPAVLLCTYTAMMHVRTVLRRSGFVADYWLR